ncbi:MAG TPA: Rieske 2Fe-2S domain-containing protein [Vicinamibacteria bacterium]|jgi:cytochrome b6-f complex iron-sulfur subunit
MAEENKSKLPPVAEAPAPPAEAAANVKKDDTKGTTRREFNWLALAWTFFAASAAAGFTAMGRFMFPNVLTEPPSSFKVGLPTDFAVGAVDERFKEKFRVWVVRNEEGMYAISAICTHLGCTPNWLSAENKFKCPCHGSGFYMSGINFEGPAPRPLERVKISLADDGQVLIDKGRTFKQEAGQWNDPESFLRLS